MRITIGLLLAVLCLPCRSGTPYVPDMTALAGVPIRVFDLRADGVSESFREFLQTVPMTNDRPVPERLVDDTLASLSVVRATTPEDVPAYFVAAWIHKTPLVSMADADRNRYLARYGEPVYPQRVCPVFLTPSNGGVARLLGVATGLPAGLFADVPGDAASFERLFALTEASHCGFIARELVQPTVLPSGLGTADTRTILEALGDFEATAVSRSRDAYAVTADEADVLFAARVLATFFHRRENPYTAVPALILEYRRIGTTATHHRLGRVRHSVRVAREAVRGIPGLSGQSLDEASLTDLAAALAAARRDGRLTVVDPLAQRLIRALASSLSLLAGDRTVRVFPQPDRAPRMLVTLTGSDRR